MAQQVRVQSCAWSVHMRIVICSNQRGRIRHGVAAMLDDACFLLLLLLAGGAWQGWLRLQRQQAEGKLSLHCTQRPPHMRSAVSSDLPPHSAALSHQIYPRTVQRCLISTRGHQLRQG